MYGMGRPGMGYGRYSMGMGYGMGMGGLMPGYDSVMGGAFQRMEMMSMSVGLLGQGVQVSWRLPRSIRSAAT